MRNRLTAIMALIALMATGCVHEWPVPVPADTTIKLQFSKELPQGPQMEWDTRSSDSDSHDMRYTMELYAELSEGKYDESAPYAKYVFSKSDITEIDTAITINIMEGKYLCRVWADYVDNGSVEDKYYNPDNFKYIKLLGRDENVPHSGNNDYRDAFMGTKEIEVIKFGGNRPVSTSTIEMTRPLSKVVFITTDLRNWKTKVLTNIYEAMLQGIKSGEDIDMSLLPTDVDLDQYIVKIHYPLYMPNSFDMVEDALPWSDQGVSFESKLIQINEDEASIGFDYVFARKNDAKVDMTVSLHSSDGVEMARSNIINVILERGKVTTVKGSFLLNKSDGGVSINPDFDGEFNIEL